MLSDGLAKTLLPPAGVGDRAARAGAAVAADDVDGEGLVDVQVGRVGRGHLARLRQRDRDVLGAADRQRRALQRVVEAELEGDVFLAVAVVVDVDLVERVRVELEVVRAAVRVLQRQVVGDQRDVAGAAGLVAVEHVEVGAVDLGRRRDRRRLAVARRMRRQDARAAQRRDGSDDRQQAGAGGWALFMSSAPRFEISSTTARTTRRAAGPDGPQRDRIRRLIRSARFGRMQNFAVAVMPAARATKPHPSRSDR